MVQVMPDTHERPVSPRKSVVFQTRPSLAHIVLRKRKPWLLTWSVWLINNQIFKMASYTCLFAALYVPDIFILENEPSFVAMNVVLLMLFAFFVFEFSAMCVADGRKYVGTFFFYMDIVSTFSLFLDITWILGKGDETMAYSDRGRANIFLLRAARIARLGARAGRITRVMRLLRWLPGMRVMDDDSLGTAKVISQRLTLALSQRVAFLVLLVAMISPLFSSFNYPDADYSMEAFSHSFTRVFATSAGAARDAAFDSTYADFVSFYEDKNYYPCTLELRSLSNPTTERYERSIAELPIRVSNRLVVVYEDATSGASFTSVFSFESPNKFEAAMSVGLMTFVILVIVVSSLLFSNVVSAIVLLPLERLLTQIKTLSKSIFKGLGDLDKADDSKNQNGNKANGEGNGGSGSYDEQPVEFTNEAALLEKIVQKLALLSETTVAKRPVDDERMKSLKHEDIAVLNMVTEQRVSHNEERMTLFDAPNVDLFNQTADVTEAISQAMISHGITVELINSWNFNPLDLSRPAAFDALTYMFFASPQSGCVVGLVDLGVFGRFVKSVADLYQPNPYHRWEHGVDVVHTVYRYFCLTEAESFLKPIERFSLLFSALCHDVGHPGVNNQFLAESNHELAIRYNDKSPLENMHCALFFDIASHDETNIFSKLSKDQYRDARKIAVEAILHTDNVHHFQMVKDLQVFYQLNKEVVDESSETTMELYKKTEHRPMIAQLFLHAADISNQTKPWEICQRWSLLVIEEFFNQGDREKELGITVQMLNDREKVNVPHSQIGFIEFVVSPLFVVATNMFPTLKYSPETLMDNMASWARIWTREYKPSQEDQDKVMARIRSTVAKYEGRIFVRPVSSLIDN